MAEGRKLRTKRPVTWTPRLWPITVPQGTKVVPIDGEPGKFWVADLSFLKGNFYHFDAEHYGIRVDAADVEEEEDARR